MSSNLLGFTVSISPISDKQFFNSDIKIKQIIKDNIYFKIYYLGNDVDCDTELYFSNYTDSLLDRNIKITLLDNEVIIENDWLGSIPIFYNSKAKIISTYHDDCIFDNLNLDDVGFSVYSDFGFSGLGTSPFQDVNQLRFYSTATFSSEGIFIEEKKDPALDIIKQDKEVSPSYLNEKIKHYFDEHIDREKDIIIPLSGGYDSRYLTLLLKDHDPTTYSYGYNLFQSRSWEVSNAKKVANSLKLNWNHVLLSDSFQWIDEWHNIFGSSTHLHGMYQMEFYSKIEKSPGSYLISGILGDLWLQDKHVTSITSPEDIVKLSLSYGMNLSGVLKSKLHINLYAKLYSENKDLFQCQKYLNIMGGRTKLTLLSYLMSTPSYFGFNTLTPFLNFDIVNAMLSIKDRSRLWQENLFETHKIGGFNKKILSRGNTLYERNFKKYDFSKNEINYDKYEKYLNLEQLKKNIQTVEQLSSFNLLKSIFSTSKGLRRIFNYKNKMTSFLAIVAIEKTIKNNN